MMDCRDERYSADNDESIALQDAHRTGFEPERMLQIKPETDQSGAGQKDRKINQARVEYHQMFPKAWSRSAIRSSTSSMPTDNLTRLSVMPSRARSSSGNDPWLMVTGCPIRLSTPPRLSASVNTVQASSAPRTPPMSVFR